MQKVINNVKNKMYSKKVPDIDGITNEMLKCEKLEIQLEITRLFEKNYKHKNNRRNERSITIPGFKKG
jgi:hypothetical protein